MTSHPLTPSHALHLMRRTWGSMRAAPLTPREEAEVAGLLDDPLASLFWEQPTIDQRHGIDAAHFVLESRPGHQELARAALLHDVGKRHAGLGIVGRIAATLLALLHLPARGRFRTYLDHADQSAVELESAGAGQVVVDYARQQDGSRPESLSPAEWALLKEADGEKHRVGDAAQYDGA